MQIQNRISQLNTVEKPKTKNNSINFQSSVINNPITQQISENSLKILGAATAAITAASIAIRKKSETSVNESNQVQKNPTLPSEEEFIELSGMEE